MYATHGSGVTDVPYMEVQWGACQTKLEHQCSPVYAAPAVACPQIVLKPRQRQNLHRSCIKIIIRHMDAEDVDETDML